MSTVEQSESASHGPEEGARRPRASTRIPFDGVVEVGGELGPPFEAQAVDVSGTGMHLRTAYLPEVGQALSCRFEAGRETVVATGEVVWQKEAGRGGEFGLRFVDLDGESAAALERMTDRVRLSVPGAKVRLHIDGLGAPMRARVKAGSKQELTVGSELGFLQVGKPIDLEDAESGNRRPASIDRVEVEIDPGSRVPQLVVALKYEDEQEETMDHVPAPPAPSVSPMQAMADDAHDHSTHDDAMHDDPMHDDGGDDVNVHVSDPMHTTDVHAHADVAQEEIESMKLKSPVARAASKVTPALERFAKRTKTTAMLLIERAKARRATESSPIRRTTSLPPGGGLHTAGRKVVRGEPAAPEKPAPRAMAGIFADRKKTMMVGASAVMVLAIGAAIASKKAAPAATPETTAAAASPDPAAAPGAPASTAASPATPAQAAAAPALTPVSGNPDPAANGAPATPPSFGEPVVADSVAVGGDDRASSRKSEGGKKTALKVAPFSYGNVTRGNVLRLKMDGSIDKLQGAQQPTGFTVHIPGRRSLEPAAPLAARDARIGSIKVVNDPGGAELAVTFKDGVPNYTVRAKGDNLEIVLASPNAGREADSTKDGKPSTVAKHAKTGGKKHGKHRH